MKRTDSLKRKKEFRYTYRVGKSTGHRVLALVHAKSRLPVPRVGFSVSKKIGKAVVRNRVKRRMRAAVTPLLPNIKGGTNIIFIARAPIVEAPFEEICSAMQTTLSKAGLLNEQ